MHIKSSITLVFLLASACLQAGAKTIKGEVADRDSKHPVSGVTIQNIYTALQVSTNDEGGFIIAATKDQLLEFKKSGYQTVRVRIPNGIVPPYFKILMEHGITKMDDVLAANNNRYDYHDDSLRFHELYKHQLDFQKLSAIGSIAHPFSAMSAKNREIWKFQETFAEAEKEKYVDKTFNAALITKFTGLTGDSLKYYMVRYRPSYEELRNMNDYSFFTYIKKAATIYRGRSRGRSAQ
jgi:hypothetical protein